MSFDRLARHYRWMEAVLAGKKLQQCRVAHLKSINPPKRILLCGEGPGRCLIECRQAFPEAELWCVDASNGMLEVARERLQQSEFGLRGSKFLQEDLLQWEPPKNHFDVVITHFFLDCFRQEQLEQVIPRIAAGARRGANWLLADFQVPNAGIKKYRAEVILGLMYGFFCRMTKLPARRLTAPDPWLEANRFTLRARQVTEWGLLRSDWWQLVT